MSRARWRTARAPAAAPLVAALLAGCGSGQAAKPGSGSTAASSSGGGTVTISAANGKVTVPRMPRRIVSLSPTSTEDLFAIGAGHQVVAVDDQSNYPPRAPHTKLSSYRPNVEAIASYHPDLVVVSSEGPSDVVTGLSKVHIPVISDPAAKNLAQAYGEIERLGTATGHREQAQRVVTHMRTRLAALVRSVGDRGRGLSVYHEVSPDGYSATSQTFVGQIYRQFGLRDIADKAARKSASDYPKLSAEYVIGANPDLVVLSDTVCCAQTPAKVAKRPGWKRIAAVCRHEVVPVNDDIASRWGPRILLFAGRVAEAIRTARPAGASP